MENINEGVATNYIKKNKILISKAEKYLGTKVAGKALINNKSLIDTKLCSIPNGLKLLYPKLKYLESGNKRYYMEFQILADTSVETYSKGNKVWLGYKFSKVSATFDKKNTWNGLSNFITDGFEDVYYYKRVDIKSDRELFKRFIDAAVKAGIISPVSNIDSISNSTLDMCYNNLNYGFLREFGKSEADLFEDKLQKILDNISDNLHFKTIAGFFKDCDKRDDFIPIIEVDTETGKVWGFDTTTPTTPRSQRFNYDSIEGFLKDIKRSSFNSLYVGILNNNLSELLIKYASSI